MAERTPLMAGNWKMHLLTAEAAELARSIDQAARQAPGVEVMLAPPFTALAAVGRALADGPVALGAQNVYPADKGAFTGEVSPPMLIDAGARYVIIGHSERRQIFGESDGFINQKAAAVLAAGLRPVLCVGESLDDRQADRTEAVVLGQLEAGLSEIKLASGDDLVVAYEPIWAIGTGLTASPDQAQEVHAAIRKWLENRFNKGIANSMRILYGGSVNETNVRELMARPDLDGALVGGASLKAESFSAIVGFKS